MDKEPPVNSSSRKASVAETENLSPYGQPMRTEGTISNETDCGSIEEALAKSEARWRNVLTEMPQIGISLNPEGHIIFANKYFLKLTGWKEEEALGSDWFDLCIPEQEREIIRTLFRHVMEGRDTCSCSTYENDIVTKRGERRTIAWSNVLTFDLSGEVRDVTCLGIDISERKKDEEALSQREAYFRSIFMGSSAVMFIIDPESGRIVDANESAVRFYGYPRETLVSMRIQDINTLPADEVKERMRQAKEQAQRSFQFSHRLADGGRRFVDVYSGPIEVEGRTLLLSIVHDVTDKRQAEIALEENEHLQKSLLQAMRDVVTLKDLEGRFLVVNEAFCRFIGRREEDVVGRHVVEVCTPELADILMAEDETARTSAEGIEHFSRIMPLDGRNHQLDVFKTLVYDNDGRPSAVLSVAHDNTALLDAVDRAKTLANEREVLLREVHHRVRNNLQVIASLMSMQARDVDNFEARDILQRSMHRVESMALLHEQLYKKNDFTRIDMHEYFRTLVVTVLQLYQAQEAPAKFRVVAEAEGVELALDQAVPCGLLVNELLTNAFRHAFVGRAEGTVRVHCRQEMREGNVFVVLCVEDDGVGLHVESSAKHLGTELVRILTCQLHGELSQENRGGAHICVTFPRET